jgi:hypothetical protein
LEVRITQEEAEEKLARKEQQKKHKEWDNEKSRSERVGGMPWTLIP